MYSPILITWKQMLDLESTVSVLLRLTDQSNFLRFNDTRCFVDDESTPKFNGLSIRMFCMQLRINDNSHIVRGLQIPGVEMIDQP